MWSMGALERLRRGGLVFEWCWCLCLRCCHTTNCFAPVACLPAVGRGVVATHNSSSQSSGGVTRVDPGMLCEAGCCREAAGVTKS